jgi:hypothetical protein
MGEDFHITGLLKPEINRKEKKEWQQVVSFSKIYFRLNLQNILFHSDSTSLVIF